MTTILSEKTTIIADVVIPPTVPVAVVVRAGKASGRTSAREGAAVGGRESIAAEYRVSVTSFELG